ncbi:MAG: HDOD domain-containing protein [Opitutaceae bacterium]|nr:HDOD domain-containing protein [Opitutaceae bacterium]
MAEATASFSREKLLEIARTLPPAPKVLARLSQLIEDINVDLGQVADLIKRDGPLTARLMHISNSVFHGTARIGSIDEAVNRVGLSEVHRIVGLITSKRLAENPLEFYGVSTELLHEHMLYTALASEALAEVSEMDPRNAYTGGLMRPLGILILDRLASRMPALEPYDHALHGSYVNWEGRTFGVTNCDVAALVFADWWFPQEIINGVRDHYLLRDEDLENRFACLLNLAGRLAAVAGFDLPGERRHWELSPRKLAAAGMSDAQVEEAAEEANRRFARLRTSLR